MIIMSWTNEIHFYFMFMGFDLRPACMSVHHFLLLPVVARKIILVSNPLGLQLEIVMNCHVDAGN